MAFAIHRSWPVNYNAGFAALSFTESAFARHADQTQM
jgi:hypothetical protein